jgi:hypothetical protein
MAIRPAPFLFGQTLETARQPVSGSLSTAPRFVILEIHKVFLRITTLSRENISCCRLDDPFLRACLF